MARNFGRLVQQLRSERSALEREIARLNQAISALEGGAARSRGRKAAGGGAGRRRRSKMSASARKAVSLRMKKYWAARRKASA